MQALMYGDLLMTVLYRTRPYEVEEGSANALYEKWEQTCKHALKKASHRTFRSNVKKIVKDFEDLPIFNTRKPRVGLVGEILVKFHPTANNNVVSVVESEGAEAVVPGLVDFLLYCAYHSDQQLLLGSKVSKIIGESLIQVIEWYRKPMKEALEKSSRFTAPKTIHHVAKGAEQFVSLGHRTGEGWLLTGEMVELIEMNVKNIICMQPFACLPNHVTGKGIIKELKRAYPGTNIVAVDYDPGASEVNQLNRIKLMISTAFENMPVETEIKVKAKSKQEPNEIKGLVTT